MINTQNTSKIDIAKLNLVTNPLIEQRISEFQELHKKDNKAWFSELCFCLLTANSKTATAIQIQNEIGPGGFLNFSENERDALMAKLNERNIDSRPYFYPISEMPMYPSVCTPVTKLISKRGINLPSYYDMTKDQVSYICKELKELL